MRRSRTHAAHAVRRSPRSWPLMDAALVFFAGMVVMAAIVAIFPVDAPIGTRSPAVASPEDDVEVDVKPSLKEAPPAVALPPRDAANSGLVAAISADPVEELRRRDLTLPVHGIKRDDLRDGFNEMRGSGRRHEAIDVLAPRHTPVVAVEDGTVARLFLSDVGGITVYQFDSTEHYVYYYAPLQNYAPGLTEGDHVKRGEVSGNVGTTGNAPRDTPHLHFAIFKMTGEKKWWQGTPIDPHAVLR